MAMKPWTVSEIQSVADDMQFVADRFRAAAMEMQEKTMPTVVLQAEVAFGQYRTAFLKLAGAIESEIRDQHRAARMGTVPRWKINQKVVEARRAAKADRIAKGIEPAKPTKKKKPKAS